MLNTLFSDYKTPLIQVGDWFALRIKQLFFSLVGIASVLSLHSNLLHLSEPWNDRIILLCLILMSLNHSVVEVNK